MNKWIVLAALTALPAVAQTTTGYAFQSVFTGSGDGVTKIFTPAAKVVTGHPISATQEHHSLQVLADGTRIESKTTDKFYRDDQGRTRIEREDGAVLIDDPVKGSSAEIHSAGRVVNTRTFNTSSMGLSPAEVKLQAEAAGVAVHAATIAGGPETAAVKKVYAEAVGKYGAEAAAKAQTQKEDLGFQSFGTVSAQGTRITTTIPQGQIGNDRPIRIVSEQWTSPELQMLVKSTNQDPRFGETSYELTNIVQGAPDPALFQIPQK
jgi:hypothetical protein